MKSLLLSFFILAITTTSMAQSSQNVSTAKSGSVTSTDKSRGFKVGLVYSNLTDSSNKTSGTVSTQYGDVSYDSTSHSGGHIGLMGINAGYKNKYLFGSMFGFDTSASILKAINGSEFETKVTVYKVQGAGTISFADMFSFVGGLNVSYFGELASEGVEVQPGVGFDAGLQADLSNGLSILAGMQALGLTMKQKNEDFKSETLVNGFITQISYTF